MTRSEWHFMKMLIWIFAEKKKTNWNQINHIFRLNVVKKLPILCTFNGNCSFFSVWNRCLEMTVSLEIAFSIILCDWHAFSRRKKMHWKRPRNEQNNLLFDCRQKWQFFFTSLLHSVYCTLNLSTNGLIQIPSEPKWWMLKLVLRRIFNHQNCSMISIRFTYFQ